MKRFCIATGVALLVLGLMAGCGGNQTSIQNNTGATLINISPSAAKFGSNTDFTITVTASSFNPFSAGTVVEWTGNKLVTSAIPTGDQATTITATVPHSLLAKPGTAFITTLTPQSGAGNNGISNSLTFLVYGNPNPAPSLSGISPNSANTCASSCSNVTVTLTGTNFLTAATNGGSSVTYTGAATGGVETAINVSSISSTQIKAVIPGTYLTNADSAQINVINPPSAVCLVNCPNLGGGDTNAPGNVTTQIFTIGGGSASGNSTGATSATAEEETPALSQDGRYVAYASQQNDTTQIFVRDTCLGATQGCTASTQPVSVASDGTPANAESHAPSMSSDGRYIAFSSAATNLSEGAPAGRQIYLRDTCVGAAAGCKAATSLISVDSSGSLTGTEAILPSVSSSGRFIAFVAVTKSNAPSASTASSAAAPAAKSATPNSGLRQVFVRDTCLGATSCTPKTTRISMQPGDESSGAPKAAGPAISGLAGQIALPDGKSSTFFTKNRPVDDRVFLAATGDSASQ